MQHLIKFCLSAGILTFFAFTNQTYANEIDIKAISAQLEKSLNSRDTSKLNELMVQEVSSTLEPKFQHFIQKFPNAKWSIQPGERLKDNREALYLHVTAEKKVGDRLYQLDAKQKLAITKNQSKIIKKDILSEYAILQNISQPLEISINIPDVVLTGTNYDIDIVLEKPLQDSIIAGGLIHIAKEEKETMISPIVELTPMGSGGLFKSVKALSEPGTQNWAALIAHPKGVISITKMVRVVSNSEDLIP